MMEIPAEKVKLGLARNFYHGMALWKKNYVKKQIYLNLKIFSNNLK